MRPRLDGCRHQPDTGASARRVADRSQKLKLGRRQWGRRLKRIARRRRPIRRHKLHQTVAHGLRQRHGSPSGAADPDLAVAGITAAADSELAVPQFLELLRQRLAVVRPALGTPRPVHAERLKVVLPARSRLVDAAAERHPITRPVREHPELRVEVALPGLGTYQRNTTRVAWHADPDLKPALAHQPRNHLETLAGDVVGTQHSVHIAVQAVGHDIGELRLAEQCVTVVLGQLRADQQPDSAAVADEPRQPCRCRPERRR